MSKTVLFAGAAAFALIAGGASAAPSIGISGARTSAFVHVAKGAKMLWNQNSNTNGSRVDSQNYTSGTLSGFDDQGADDFVVPKKQEWTVTEIDVSGTYFQGYGPATSENVIFYSNNSGVPGKAVKGGTFTGLNGTDSSGSFAISLGKKGVKLKSGTYWVSVIANCSYHGGCGEWGWDENATVTGYEAQWRNPGGDWGVCPTWDTLASCTSSSADFAFDLQGKSTKKK